VREGLREREFEREEGVRKRRTRRKYSVCV
jgi:hypothetical protein